MSHPEYEVEVTIRASRVPAHNAGDAIVRFGDALRQGIGEEGSTQRVDAYNAIVMSASARLVEKENQS